MRDFSAWAKEAGKSVYRFVTHRILWLLMLLVVLFYLLFARLFTLQVVNAESYKKQPPRTKTVTVPIPALRGAIYDRQGRPLAVNNLAYVVKMDPSIPITNEGLYELVKIFERNGEDYADNLPITQDEPYAFTYPESQHRERQEFRWKDDMTVENPETATAPEAFRFLRTQFKIDPGLSNREARKILNLRCMLYMERFMGMENYDPTPVAVAYDVSPATVAAIEENNALLPGVYMEVEALREYPQDIYFSHMLGYVQRINDTEYENNKDKGYTHEDLIGKSGLERTFEQYLRGESGAHTLEVDSRGRRVGLPEAREASRPGDKIFLTVDAYLQRKAYHALEDALTQTLVNKLNQRDAREDNVTVKELFVSLIESNNLNLKAVLDAEEGRDAFMLKRYILERFPEANATERESVERVKTLLTEGLEANRVAPATVLLTLIDTGLLTDADGALAAQLRNAPRERDVLAVVTEKLKAKELTPQLINLDPCTGSVVVVDVKNGDVLAAAGYPSYDNNRFVNVFDNAYYYQVYFNDPTNPGLNRPFMEPRAPGSTFKMITAAAALETGTITPQTRILTEAFYTKTGRPHTGCWSRASHGNINVTQALAVSCNYFFCEAAWRLGNVREDTTTEGINALNDYMVYFGLNSKTGVEIGEHYNIFDDVADLSYRISSPEFKKYQELNRDPFAARAEWDWYDGDTVRTAIGQSKNNYTAAMMARYVSVIANRGVRYPLHLVQTVEDYQGALVSEYQATPDELPFAIADSTWDALTEGMRMVTETGSGTASAYFKDYPIQVAGKTGTAEESSRRLEHSSFAAFAPLDDPRIAVYVCVPFGSSRYYTHIATRVAQEMMSEALGLAPADAYRAPINTLRK